MSMRIAAGRIRPSLVQTYRTVQLASWFIGTSFIAVLIAADPEHRFLNAAASVFTTLITIILK